MPCRQRADEGDQQGCEASEGANAWISPTPQGNSHAAIHEAAAALVDERSAEEDLRRRERGYDCSSRSKIGRRRAAVAGRSSGSTRVSPTTVMKLVSPFQRGTRCTCRWSSDAGAGRPAEIDADVDALRRGRPRVSAISARRVNAHQLVQLVAASASASVGDVPVRHHHQVAVVVGIEVEDDERMAPRRERRASRAAGSVRGRASQKTHAVWSLGAPVT